MKNMIISWVMAVLFLVTIAATANDETHSLKQNKKIEELPEKKVFMPWLLKDFKISKEGATLSVTKEKADYFDLYHLPKHGKILKDKTIYFKPTDNDSPALSFSRYLYKNTVHGARTSSFYICYDKNILDSDDGDVVLKKIMERYLNPLRVYESYCQLSKDKKNERGYAATEWEIYEKLYVFPVLKEEREAFLKLVPADQFQPEVYDSFVVLRRIHSKEEAEKRKDFLLNTDGKSKGMWDIVEKYKGERKRPKPIHVDILNPEPDKK